VSKLTETNTEDYSLIDRFLSGNEEAFEKLVKKYQNFAVNIAYSLSGESRYAEDIAQEAFIKVYQNLAAFEKKAAFSTWLYRIVANTTYNYLRSKKSYVSLDNVSEGIELKKSSLDELESKEKQQIINKAIRSLPFKYRTVLTLKDVEGLSYAEIAQVVGCRIGTVESRLFRARSMLKKILSPLLEKEGRI
jgi:RNA polymerase sigma-70 factor (ECF subfamily)